MQQTLNGIKELRESMNMNRKEFSAYYEIPYRTIQEWEADTRKAPPYILRLMKYMALAENKISEEGK